MALAQPHTCSFCRDLLQTVDGFKPQHVLGDEWFYYQDLVLVEDFQSVIESETNDFSSLDENEKVSCDLLQYFIRRSRECSTPAPQAIWGSDAFLGRGPVTPPKIEYYNDLVLRIVCDKNYDKENDYQFTARPNAHNAMVWLQGRILEYFNAYRPRGSSLPLFWLREQPNRDLASPIALQQIRTWAQDCYSSHKPNCPGQHNSEFRVLPSRVLDVASATLRIVEPKNGTKGDYATLSYCWGNVNPIQLSLSNINKLLNKMDEEKLPKTIRDAIFVTRQLKLNYLWIDALCIIQDDEGDRDLQLAKMPEIYLHSYITISAATSISSETGFLQERGLPSTCRRFAMRYFRNIHDFGNEGANDHKTVSTNSEKEPLFIMDTMHYPTIYDEPLASRAWTLQETLLSPRIAYFGYRQLEFRCWSRTWNDGGYHDHRRDRTNLPISNVNSMEAEEKDSVGTFLTKASTKSTKFLSSVHKSVSSVIPERVKKMSEARPVVTAWENAIPRLLNDPLYKTWGINLAKERSKMITLSWVKSAIFNLSSYAVLNLWHDIVRSYSLRKITYLDDKLRAISAIAQHLQALSELGTYLAGLWSEMLCYQLCWYRDVHQNSAEPSSVVVRSKSSYMAPSWSWAAINSPVFFLTGSTKLITQRESGSIDEDEANGTGAEEWFMERLKIMKHSITLGSGQSKFYSFTAGYLIVSGRIQHIVVTNTGLVFVKSLSKLTPLVSAEHQRLITWSSNSADQVIFDHEGDEAGERTEFICLEVLVLANNKVHGLVLKKVDGENAYCRIGLAILQNRTGLFEESDELVSMRLI